MRYGRMVDYIVSGYCFQIAISSELHITVIIFNFTNGPDILPFTILQFRIFVVFKGYYWHILVNIAVPTKKTKKIKRY